MVADDGVLTGVKHNRWDKKLGRFLMNGVLEQAKARGKECIMLQQVRDPGFILTHCTLDQPPIDFGSPNDDNNQVANNVKSYALYARMEFLPVDACLSLEGFVYEYLEPDPRTCLLSIDHRIPYYKRISSPVLNPHIHQQQSTSSGGWCRRTWRPARLCFSSSSPASRASAFILHACMFVGSVSLTDHPSNYRNETRDAIEAGVQAAAKGDEGTVTHCVTRRGEDGKVRSGSLCYGM